MKFFIVSILFLILPVSNTQAEEVTSVVEPLTEAHVQCQKIISKPGRHSKKEYKQAFEACSAAAEDGDSRAQYQLGIMYYKGTGIPQDFVLAYMWFKLAADQGNNRAQPIMRHLTTQMTNCQITEALYLANTWEVDKSQCEL